MTHIEIYLCKTLLFLDIKIALDTISFTLFVLFYLYFSNDDFYIYFL